jgi:hypothetical protein
MSTITSSIRTVIAIGTVGAALASTGVASARSLHHHAGTGRAVVVRTIAVSSSTSHLGSGGPVIVVSKAATRALDAGSAGIPGYDDAACQGLLHDLNTAVDHQEHGITTGNDQEANTYGALANQIYGQLTDNCLVVY